jgi:hypothetical protein
MWRIGTITPQYRQCMNNILNLYEQPYNRQEPVVCVDEKSKQLLDPLRPKFPLKPGQSTLVDYEYERKGTRNLFVAICCGRTFSRMATGTGDMPSQKGGFCSLYSSTAARSLSQSQTGTFSVR